MTLLSAHEDEASAVVADAESLIANEALALAGGTDHLPFRAPLVVASAALAGLAAVWLSGGLFSDGVLPRLHGLAGLAIGLAVTGVSLRAERASAAQYALIPIAVVAGAIAITPVATGGTANLPSLVGEALSSGGLLQPPIPLDPGWRFILVALFAVVGGAAVALAGAYARPKLAVVVPLPLVVGGALLQPPEAELLASAVAVVLVIGALAVAYGVDLRFAEGVDGRAFEVRRLGRGVILLVALAAGMVGLAQADVLFPEVDQDQVIPPQKPPAVPLEPDRELFRVRTDRTGPWRVGVLDVYDIEDQAWLLPALDESRIVELDPGDRVPGARGAGPTSAIAFEIVDVRGRNLPAPGQFRSIREADGTVELDPRTGVPRLAHRVPAGFEYVAEVGPLPTGQQLNASGPPNAAVFTEFGVMPPPPAEVVALLAQAPAESFDRLQFVRDHLYANVVAAGAGSPIDVPPARVGALLRPAAEATPYEISAAEAMLARWAGVPARIGFGYHGGDEFEGGFSLRPRHGAAWLEAWFEGYGWVALVGTPPQARSSLDNSDMRDDQTVLASDELALKVYVPVQRFSPTLLFEIIRYWLLVALPFVTLIAALVFGFPAACKLARSRRRQAWAKAHGPLGRVLAAYGEFRDRCNDLNLGSEHATPLELRGSFPCDDEHDELAWSVTRLLWGDLRRDARDTDALAVERLAVSMRGRITSAQPATNRLLALVARASLRDPWSDQLPNLWPNLRPRAQAGAAVAGLRRRLRTALRRLQPWVLLRRRPSASSPLVLAALLVAAATILGGCAQQGGFDGAKKPAAYPDPLLPEPPLTLRGLEFHRANLAEKEFLGAGDRALVTEGRVFTIRDGDTIQGSVQVSLLLPELDGRDPKVQQRIEAALGGTFVDDRLGPARVRRRRLPEQDLYLWFPPGHNAMEVVVVRRGFSGGRELVRAVVVHQLGFDTDRLSPAGDDAAVDVSTTEHGPSEERP